MIIRIGAPGGPDGFVTVAEAVQPDPGGRLAAWIRRQWPAFAHDWSRTLDTTMPAASSQCKGVVNWPTLPPPAINAWLCPNGMSRASRGVFLFDKESVAALDQTIDSLGAGFQLQLGDDLESLVTWSVSIVEAMRLNTPDDEGNELWAVLFSDAFRVPTFARRSPLNWNETMVGPGSNATPLDPDVPSVFGKPAAWPWRDRVAPWQVLADIAAWSLGRRVAKPGRPGNVRKLMTADQATEIAEANLGERGCSDRIVARCQVRERERISYQPWFAHPQAATTLSGSYGTPLYHRKETSVEGDDLTGEWLEGAGGSPADQMEAAWANEIAKWSRPRYGYTFAGIADWINTGEEDYTLWECWPKPVTRVVPMPNYLWCPWHIAANPDAVELPDTILVNVPSAPLATEGAFDVLARSGEILVGQVVGSTVSVPIRFGGPLIVPNRTTWAWPVNSFTAPPDGYTTIAATWSDATNEWVA